MLSNNFMQYTETPRDTMQGLIQLIPTETKAAYIRLLLKAGFETLDCGSFVSPTAIPQMADTAKVLSKTQYERTITKRMVLVGNTRGGQQAAQQKVDIIAFPYSVSQNFLKRNLNTTSELAWRTILDLSEICKVSNRDLRVYVAMAFGNPYGDPFSDDLVIMEVARLRSEGIRNIVFSDITGEGTPESIERISTVLLKSFPDLTLGIHLHTRPEDWQDKLEAAWRSGMRNFEGAIGGYGGCPMTGYEMLGNLNTLHVMQWCEQQKIGTGISSDVLAEAGNMASKIFRGKKY